MYLMTLLSYRKKTDELLTNHRLARSRAEVERRALDAAEAEALAVADAQRILQGIAQTLQQRAHVRIAGVVTRCLTAVFDDPYEFRIGFDRKRGKTEARLTFVRNGREYDDPLNEVGGGVVDVAALALRLACVLLARPVRRRLLILDEPFKFIRGAGERARTRRMLLGLAEELGFQFVLSTDIPEYRLGKVIEFG